MSLDNTAHLPNSAIAAMLAQQAQGGVIHTDQPVPLLVTSSSLEIQSLEALQTHPLRTGALVCLHTLDDLVRYLLSQQNPAKRTVLFANRSNLSFAAFLDYHSPELPSWLDHQINVRYELSQQLKTWLSVNNKFMSQEQFAEFLDENLPDIQSPTAASVLDFVEALECTRKETFRSAIKQTTGEVQFLWAKENQETDRASILEEFTLGIPLWHRGEAIAIKAKLFHRITEVEGKARLTFKYRLEELERIQDKLWDEDIAKLRERLTEVGPVYEGLPPSRPQSISL